MLPLRKSLKNLKKLKKLIVLSKRSQERIRILEERMFSLEWSLLAERRLQVENLGNTLRPAPNTHQLSRFGSDGDGGYALPTDLKLPDVVISVGVGSECSVDDQLARLGARVIQFDHTVAQSPSTSQNVVFHQIGLSGSVSGTKTQPLASLLELARAEGDTDVWLMLDAEGVEWDLLSDATAPLERFAVINIEFHRLTWIMKVDERSASMIRGLERLRKLFVPIAWHANNYAPAMVIGGRWVPDVLEVTFVSQSYFRAGETLTFEEHMRPNNPNAVELPVPFSEALENPYGPRPERNALE